MTPADAGYTGRTWLLGGGALLLFIGFLTYMGYANYWSTLKMAEQDTAARARLLAQQTELLLIGQQQLLSGLHLMTDVAPEATQPFSTDIRHLLKQTQQLYPHLMDLLIINPDGAIIHWTGPGTPPDVRDRGYVTYHLQPQNTNPIYVGPPLLSRVHKQQWFFALSTADHKPDGSLDHIIVAIIDLSLINHSYMELLESGQTSFVLASKQGEIYAREPDNGRFVGRVVAEIPSNIERLGPEATLRMISPLDGLDRIVTSMAVRGFPLLTIVSLSVGEVLEGWRRTATLLAIFALLGGGAILMITMTLVRIQQRLFTLSISDPLTQLLNRRHFITLAQQEIKRTQRYERPFTLMMLDLDHFKRVNDLYGHPAGNQVLLGFADVMRESCRSSDLIGRFGGEEFIILLPETDLKGGQLTAEKILHRTRELLFIDHGLEGVQISCSIGVTQLLESDNEIDTLIQRSDVLLYQAKQRGRNCVVTDADPSVKP